ncbi:MAG: PLP-dependent aminotransferase family protein [Microscillaceae bacterium]|nr:PLP-dependent aminotransferase family protein [Microscillaceae bacterium]
MHPFLQEIHLEPQSESPIYVQIANQIVSVIQRGILPPGFKLPGSRILADFMGVHRQTVVAALEELVLEGWLVSKSKKGTFVNQSLPEIRPKKLSESALGTYPQNTGFGFCKNTRLDIPVFSTARLQFNDGIPDTRLAPLHELARHTATLLKSHKNPYYLAYTHTQGSLRLRQALSKMLGQNRGIKAPPENIFISRGTIMALYSLAQILIHPGDRVIVGETNYRTADLCFEQAGAQICRIPVDEQGLVIEAIDKLASKNPVRALYVTSHHHHPTTVALSPERRLKLLEMARKYGFAIIEDDYDYDFHYQNRPLLPLASADCEGWVIYIGSFTKAFAPAIRTGYIVAPSDLIEELNKYRRIMDRQGDVVQEEAIAYMLEDGTIRRYLNKALKAYRERKELFCELLRDKFSGRIHFKEPEGGMAVWAQFAFEYPLFEISQKAAAKKLYISDGKWYNPPGQNLNACRMGFASMDLGEIEQAIEILEKCF